MITKLLNKKYYIPLIGIFSILPWYLSSINQKVITKSISVENLGFYQSNICDVSFFRVIVSNINFRNIQFVGTNVEDIRCYGKIMGMDLVSDKFYMYVGTNLHLNLFFQSIFWILVISLFIKKEELNVEKTFIPLLLIPVLFTFQVISESRFYSYIHDGYDSEITFFNYYLINIFLIYLFLSILIHNHLITRIKNFINYFPFMFIFVGTFFHMNINFYLIIFSFFGFYSLIFYKNYKYFNIIYFGFSFIWIVNFNQNGSYFDVDKLRGFANTTKSLSALIFWIIIIFLTIHGILYLFKISKSNLNLNLLKRNFLITGSLLFILGTISSVLPWFNFYNFYSLGLNKKGIDKIASIDGNTWRGLSSSAESVGEFYAFSLLFFFIILIKNKEKIQQIEFVYLILISIGLLRSNNFAALSSLVLITLYLFLVYKFNVKKRHILFLIVGLLIIGVMIAISYFSYGSLSKGLLFNAFESSNVFINTESYFNNLNYFEEGNILSILEFNNQGEYLSSSLLMLVEIFTTENNIPFIPNIVAVISFFSLVINRSERWGVFIAKYNPNISEFLFGYGPMQFNEYYLEHPMKEPSGLLLPHSSVLVVLIFSGFISIVIFSFLIYKYLIKNFLDLGLMKYLLIFQILNLVKSDSLLYLSSFVLFLFTFMFSSKKDEKESEYNISSI